ncbi:MAG: hypothetical protein HYW85_04535 [Deltaproteobacteria bacterium]|nr:hypothetical protein [Deltaproteobacteria bacterium]
MHIVHLQFERGIYFDTPDYRLENIGIAVRVKEWFPIGKRGKPLKHSSGRSLFLKVQRDRLGGFTVRDEYQIVLPSNFSDDDISNAISILIQHVRPELSPVFPKPVIVIENTRYSIDLGYSPDILTSHEKIGFITLDEFRARPVFQDGSGGPLSPPRRQMEVEILPQYHELVVSKLAGFEGVFSNVERSMGFILTREPKYIQGRAMLEQDYSPK